jgi:hypothetical protein
MKLFPNDRYSYAILGMYLFIGKNVQGDPRVLTVGGIAPYLLFFILN